MLRQRYRLAWYVRSFVRTFRKPERLNQRISIKVKVLPQIHRFPSVRTNKTQILKDKFRIFFYFSFPFQNVRMNEHTNERMNERMNRGNGTHTTKMSCTSEVLSNLITMEMER